MFMQQAPDVKIKFIYSIEKSIFSSENVILKYFR